MKLKIKAEKKPFAVTKFFSGTVIDHIGEHEFTVVVNINNDHDTNEVTDITWLNSQPDDTESVEDLITLAYEK